MEGRPPRWRAQAVVALAALSIAVAVTGDEPAPAQSSPSPGCVGDTEADDVAQRPGPLLRYGITPGVQAGQVGGVPAEAVPDQPPRTLAALDRLRPERAPFVLRLNRFFFEDGEAGIRRFERLTERYTSRGYAVEYQLRYHPSEEQEGDIGAWVRFVRKVVRTFGPNPKVKAIQVTNEVNLTISEDSSDGAFEGARAALVRGVIAAKETAVERGYDQLEIGFNWFYRTDPANEQSFWEYLRDRGGERFVEAVDWIGLDAYPGTFFPPAEAPGDERDGMVNAMSALRCYAAIPGIPERVPMHVEENGWPTGPGRTPEMQARVAETLVRAVHDFRGTYNVSDYRWFNLRDADSSDPRFTQQYGLIRSDYAKKPAFRVYCDLVGRLATDRGETCAASSSASPGDGGDDGGGPGGGPSGEPGPGEHDGGEEGGGDAPATGRGADGATADTATRVAAPGAAAGSAGEGSLPLTGLLVGALALAGAVLAAAGAVLRRRASPPT
ncbi:MAG: hypothetical protein ACR2IN_02700 [Thermoleophilaceae bacterium]